MLVGNSPRASGPLTRFGFTCFMKASVRVAHTRMKSGGTVVVGSALQLSQTRTLATTAGKTSSSTLSSASKSSTSSTSSLSPRLSGVRACVCVCQQNANQQHFVATKGSSILGQVLSSSFLSVPLKKYIFAQVLSLSTTVRRSPSNVPHWFYGGKNHYYCSISA